MMAESGGGQSAVAPLPAAVQPADDTPARARVPVPVAVAGRRAVRPSEEKTQSDGDSDQTSTHGRRCAYTHRRVT